MMKIKKFLSTICILFAGSFLLGGCNDSKSSAPGAGAGGPTDQSISGIVSDPAVEGAEVVLVKADGTLAKISGKTGGDGRFTLTGVPLGSLSGYRLKAVGGADTGTGEDFNNISLCLPLALYSAYQNVVVSPVACLVDAALAGSDVNAAVAAVKARLGEVDPTADPAGNPALQRLSMKLTLMLAEGKSFQEILTQLDTNAGIDAVDIDRIFTSPEARDRLKRFFSVIDSSPDGAVAESYQKELIEQAIRESFADALAALTDPVKQANADANIDKLVAHLMLLKAKPTAPRHYLTKADVVATISGGGGLTIAMLTADPSAFNPTVFKLVLVNRSATFADAAKLAYYQVDNPVTGNLQLVVYDGVTGRQTVVKNNVILGNRAFVLGGALEVDRTFIAGKRYGILLDPNQARETRTAPDGRGGFFQYEFFLDNAFKRYDVASPSNEAVIFDSSMLSQSLKDQEIRRLSGEYTLHNNISDPDSSYVDLIAFQRIPDPLQGETSDTVLQAPIVVRLVDGRMTQGRTVRILKGTDGRTQWVLINFTTIHTPAGTAPVRRLQLCPPDLSGCADVAGGGGNFFFLAESDTHIYLGKDGDASVYAFDKSAHTLGAVTGVSYPAPFDHTVHLLEVGTAHGSGGVLNDFSSLSGPTRSVSDGQNAYLAINYDLDTQNEIGAFRFGPNPTKIRLFKHGQIVKLTGTAGVKMFDNGDGVDHGDGSDGEPAVGHLNLIAVSNGRLFVESGNYDGGLGGNCVPSATGFNCSSVRYGYLNAESTVKTAFDVILQERTNLRYFTSRRIAPVAINGKLFISILETDATTTAAAVYKLHIYPLDTAVETGTSVGRTAMTKTAERANGVFDGEVLAWDAVTGELHNVTRNELVLGNAKNQDSPALNSVFGMTNGVPLAGIGNLYALRGHNGNHRWHLFAGEVEMQNGLVYVDQVPTSAWLYD